MLLNRSAQKHPVLNCRLRSVHSTLLAACLGALPSLASGHEPKPETLAAFDHYRVLTEARMDTDRWAGHFLYFDRYRTERRNEINEQLRRGEFYFEQLHTLNGGDKIPIPGGLVHHWVGIGFLPGVTLAQTKAVLEDYSNEKVIYYPEVRQSKLLSESGNDREVFLQFYSKTILTTVFNVNFHSVTSDYSSTQTQISACSTRVADVENFGTPEEHELPAAESHGYLWSLCTWWHIEERAGGSYIQVEAIELSRTVPLMFAWIVNPIIRNVPKEFLSRLLTATRKAVTAKNSEAAPKSAAKQITPLNYSQPFSAICSSMSRASELPFFEAATSSTWAWSQFFSTPSPRKYKFASITSAGT